ncbi:MAG: VWA domain-containing protein, partial [Thermoplasmatota archaeon]
MKGRMGVKLILSAALRRFRGPISVAVAVFALLCAFTSIPFQAEGSDAYTGGGYLSSRVSSSVDSFWRSGSDNEPRNATVTFAVTGTGTKGITLAPQDVVFLMDHSGSLETYDPQVLRILAAHEYVDNMIAPFDRAVVAFFDNDAQTVNDHHLSSAYAQVHADLEALSRLTPQGQTNYQAGIEKAIDEFDGFGKEENQKIIVFFTDGVPDPPQANVTISQMDEIVAKDITMFTIGLGPLVDVELLTWMAGYTGGQFYKAQTAEELVMIYLKISNQFYDYTAGANTTVQLYLHEDLDFIMGSENITEGFVSNFTGGQWVLRWDIGNIFLGQNWSVKFRIGSEDGEGKTRVFGGPSSLRSNSWLGENITDEIPEFYITIIRSLPPPLPPPPPAPPPITPAPVPPPPSVPVVAPSVNVAPVITATPNITPV